MDHKHKEFISKLYKQPLPLSIKNTYTTRKKWDKIWMKAEGSNDRVKNRINNKRCWLYSIPAIVTWAAVTSLKPGQACFPRMDCHGADGAGESVPASEPCPMGLESLLPSAQAHSLQIQEGPPAVKLCLLQQRIWSLWAGRALKSPVGSMSPGGVPTSSLLP